MDPQQPQYQAPQTPQPPQYSMDYLNQIAPQSTQKKMWLSHTQLLVVMTIGIILVIGTVLALIVAASSGPKSTVVLAARLKGTEAIAIEAQEKIKSSQLRSLNSNLKIYLTNTNRDITAPLMAVGVDTAKLDSSVVADESGDEVSQRLEDARLNAVYDRTYAREIAYRLETIVSLMENIQASTNNTELKGFLQDSINNLAPTQEQFSNYNDASS